MADDEYKTLADKLAKVEAERDKCLELLTAMWPRDEPQPDWLKELLYRGTHVVLKNGSRIPIEAYYAMREEIGRALGFVD